MNIDGQCTYCDTDSPKLRIFGNYMPACCDCYCQCVANDVAGSLIRMSAVYEKRGENLRERAAEIISISPKFQSGRIGYVDLADLPTQ